MRILYNDLPLVVYLLADMNNLPSACRGAACCAPATKLADFNNRTDAMTQMRHRNADTVIVLDFETTGMSPEMGDRAIEIGAVRIEGGQITERFQGLMNPGMRISPFIEDFTGITTPCSTKRRPVKW